MRIRIFGGYGHGSLVILDSLKNETAVLGRTDECDIIVDDTILSKKHCTFNFKPATNKWTIQDGFNLRGSLNGTWVYMSQEQRIVDNMIFRVSDVVF